MSDDELLDGFERGTLAAFPHEDHLRVAFLLTRRDGVDAAIERMSRRIRAMAIAGGDAAKFHVSRTVAWVRIVDACRAGSFEQLLTEHPELLRRDLLDDYYEPGVLTGTEARARFVEPTLRSF